ncbi:M20/M25/M40 family metallo-hydrolase [Nitratidesulfovibrio sp. HK-II]|uniref:M20 family metallopeptidase n=1 Tax=Nitratidesulfovibrio sp. HK-II TaxID=2009266 RepID=UPI000E2F661A|nr:M20/M25/M40 family metallo-hydrolase [Nitratidesulfovibrio sp. HK-II]GBO95345.1 acetylornithine deacetylase [Nitratidesulfovibrio sp. HK-II]
MSHRTADHAAESHAVIGDKSTVADDDASFSTFAEQARACLPADLADVTAEDIADMVALTARLMAIRSTASRPAEVTRCADVIAAWLADNEIPCTRMEHEGIPSLLAGNPAHAAPLALLVHFDVVDGADALFTPRMDTATGVLHGRGAIDDKYAVAMALVLCRRCLRELAVQGRGAESLPLVLVITGDEETGGRNGAFRALPHIRADFCVALDGGAPGSVITREKGVIDLVLTARGKSAHGARPWMGENAVDALVRDYEALKPLFPGQYPGPHPDRAPEGDAPRAADHWHRTMNLGLLHAGTAVNLVPGEAVAHLDVRYTEHDDPQRLVAEMRAAVQGELAVTRMEPLFVTGDTPWMGRLLRHAPGAAPGCAHGASDARFLTDLSIAGVVWGAEGETSQHTDREHLLIASLVPVYEALLALALEEAGTTGQQGRPHRAGA